MVLSRTPCPPRKGTWSAIDPVNSGRQAHALRTGLPSADIPASLAEAERLRQSLLADGGRRRFAQDDNRPVRAPSERSADDPVARPAHAGRSAPERTARLRLHPRVSTADQAPRGGDEVIVESARPVQPLQPGSDRP